MLAKRAKVTRKYLCLCLLVIDQSYHLLLDLFQCRVSLCVQNLLISVLKV